MASATLNPGNANDLQVMGDAELDTLHQPQPYTVAEHHPFMHGVASGDPLQTSVVLWTRVTPAPECAPGSGVGEDVQVTWELCENPEFSGAVRRGVATTGPDKDYTVHVDPFELEPGTEYFYRFRFRDATSAVGRTRTAPRKTSRLRCAVTSCANFEAGYFGAYGDIARRARAGHVDVVLHMGDYIYEYASGDAPGKHGVVRPHVPTWTITTLADYRSRYGHYRRDVELQAAHASAPWVVTWDDHEIANDAYEAGAEEHNPHIHGTWSQRQSAAMQAYFEWLPVRATNPSKGGHLYRSFGFGDLVDLHMLDLRTYRSAPGTMRPKRRDEHRTMMGTEQFQWLSTQLATSTAQWNLVGTSVMVANLNVVGLDEDTRNPLTKLVGETVPFNADQWDGFTADRARLLEQIQRSGQRTVFVTGDIHSEWAIDVKHNGEHIAAELVTSSVTAPNLDEFFNLPEGNAISRRAERYLRGANPHVGHVNLDAHGYALLDVTEDTITFSWQRVEDIAVAGSAVTTADSVTYDGAYLQN